MVYATQQVPGYAYLDVFGHRSNNTVVCCQIFQMLAADRPDYLDNTAVCPVMVITTRIKQSIINQQG